MWSNEPPASSVRNGVVEPSASSHDEGVMFVVWRDGGVGYGATSDLSPTRRLRVAVEQAEAVGRAHSGPQHRGGSLLCCTRWASTRDGGRTALRCTRCGRRSSWPVDRTPIRPWPAEMISASSIMQCLAGTRFDTRTILLTNGGGRVVQRYSCRYSRACGRPPTRAPTPRAAPTAARRVRWPGRSRGARPSRLSPRHRPRSPPRPSPLLDAPPTARRARWTSSWPRIRWFCRSTSRSVTLWSSIESWATNATTRAQAS